MPSLVQGYGYDIFISYRQNDNKYDGWVTEFVDNLTKELDANIKDKISIYFDINPQDGLLETHSVDQSLQEKLRCLIFLPVISRTYCDPESYAWKHELCQFNSLAKKDRLGRDIRLANGNVASRILPVKIHDLDPEDKDLLESELGGALRSIDFIYKTQGVNRPLRTSEDHPNLNLNKTYYRDQINKVSNAIREIIYSIKRNNPQNITPEGEMPLSETNRGLKINRKFFIIAGICTGLIFGILFINTLLKILRKPEKVIREEMVLSIKSINKTTDSARIINPEMIEYLLKFNLSNRCSQTFLDQDQFNKIYPSGKRRINLPRKNIVFRITNGEFLHQYEIEYKIVDNIENSTVEKKIAFRDRSNLLNLDGKLRNIIESLETSLITKRLLTNDWDAFENFYLGEKAWESVNRMDARRYFSNSLKIDSSFILPYLRQAQISHFIEDNKTAGDLIKRVMLSIDELSVPDSIRTVALWYALRGDTKEAIRSYMNLIDYMPAQKDPYFELAEGYFFNRDIKNAAVNYRKALTIDPDFAFAHNHYAYCLSHTGQHDSALFHGRRYIALEPSANSFDTYGDLLFACGQLDSAKWAKMMGLKLDPNRDYIYTSLAYINVQEGRFKEAEINLDKNLSFQQEPLPLSRGLTNKAFIYFISGDLKKSLDTCLKAQEIFDTDDLLSRNHMLHWLLSRIYIETGDQVSLNREIRQMESIIRRFNINEFNYNMIFKFYLDIKIHQFFKQDKTAEAYDLIGIFDKAIFDKVKDWTSPFDLAYFNTEFGKLYLEKDSLNPAKQRFIKALEYNPKYPFAHLGLAGYYLKTGLNDQAMSHYRAFCEITDNAETYPGNLVKEQFAKLVK